jgi:hypothetical protein
LSQWTKTQTTKYKGKGIKAYIWGWQKGIEIKEDKFSSDGIGW